MSRALPTGSDRAIRGSTPFPERGVELAVFAYAVFAFVACTSAFKLFGLGTAGFGLFYLGGAALVVLHGQGLLARPGALSLALLFPAVALCSTLWSVDPGATLRHSTQLAFTAVVGASLGCALRPRTLVVAMSAAFALLVTASVANYWLQVVPPFQQRDYLQGSEYFTGIFAHKNTFGSVLCLCALCITYLSLSYRPIWPYAVALLALVPVFLFTRSTTSIVLFGFILCMPLVQAFLRIRRSRAPLFFSALCLLIATAIALELLSVSPIDIGLELAGKGRDLSGRDFLWSVALEQIPRAPWLGVGYQVYWDSPLFATEVNLVRGTLESSIGHFHNVWLEALVGTGILGLVAIAAVPLVLATRFLVRLLGREASTLDLFGFFLVIQFLVRANVEASLYYQHQIESLSLAALLFSSGASRRAREGEVSRAAAVRRQGAARA